MKERTKFVLEWEQLWMKQEGEVNVSELCRVFGVSRQTGHKWLRRYEDAGRDVRAMEEKSRRPKTNPRAVSSEIEDLVVATRKRFPKWGPRKLKGWLEDHHPELDLPGSTTIGNILKRRGMVAPRGRRNHRGKREPAAPFGVCEQPNQVWCVDFKGWFRLGDGTICYPLTLMDAHTRYLLRCEALTQTTGQIVTHIFDSAFQEFGLPDAIRSDNGPPFASRGAGSLTRLSLWWLRLGLTLERIQPGKPQQNGRLERFHRTLKRDTEVCEDIVEQQRAYDVYRCLYNDERPHESVGNRPPATAYWPSNKRYPRKLIRPELSSFGHHEQLDKEGAIKWKKKRVFISSALRHEWVTLDPIDGMRWLVTYGAVHLGVIDDSRLEDGLIVPRRTKKHRCISIEGNDS